MRLHDVANRFNKAPCTDAYTGEYLFSGQFALYDDNKRDSETAERRILSLAPGLTLPARRVIAASGSRFILGHGNPDDHLGATIRVGYVGHEATYLSQVRTLAEVCLDQPGFTAYSGRAWLKNLAYADQSSRQTPEYHIHFGSFEPVRPNALITFESQLHAVRSVFQGPGGTLIATCEEMPAGSVETASITTGVRDPVQDQIVGTVTVAKVVRMRWQSLFSYGNSTSPKFLAGDIQVAVAKSAVTITAGTTLALADGAWRVESAVGEGQAWLCHATRYG